MLPVTECVSHITAVSYTHLDVYKRQGPYYLYRQKNMCGNLENVGYAKVDKAGIYNILIMEEKQTIIAAGAGASTKIVSEKGQKIERIENVKDVTNYISRIDEMIARKRDGIISVSYTHLCDCKPETGRVFVSF